MKTYVTANSERTGALRMRSKETIIHIIELLLLFDVKCTVYTLPCAEETETKSINIPTKWENKEMKIMVLTISSAQQCPALQWWHIIIYRAYSI